MAIYLILVNLFSLIFGTFGTPLQDNCVVSKYQDVANAVKNCQTVTLKDIVIPSKTTMILNLLKGAHLIFDGHITHVPAEWPGDLIQVKGDNVVVTGTKNHIIDGMGPKHWKGSNEPTILRPKMIRFTLTNSRITGLYLLNCANNCIMLTSSSNLYVSDILINNTAGYPGIAGEKFAKNTDGFDVSRSNDIVVENSIVYNQDDCVAVNAGNNMLFNNLYCNGSHGLSFSVFNGEATNIEFRNSHLDNAGTAIHIKTHNDGSQGLISGVLYKNITFKGIIKSSISVQQNYPKGEPRANIPIRNVTMDGIKGTVTGKKSQAIQIICAEGGCSDWHWSNIDITGAQNKNECMNVPSGVKC